MPPELSVVVQENQVVVLRRSMEEFRLLAQRFEHLAAQETDLSDLHKRQIQEMVRAGRLFMEVVDAAGFPESRKEINQGWWDRARGRVPAGPFLFLHLMTGENGTLTIKDGFHIMFGEEDKRRYMEAVSGTWEPAQYIQCWPSVVAWLVSKFPTRFAHDAASLFSNNILTKDRIPVDQDGRPIRTIYSIDGVEQPEGYEPLPMKAYPKGTHVSWDRKFVTEADVFTEANTMSKFRGMARANADACRMLAFLVADYVTDLDDLEETSRNDPAQPGQTRVRKKRPRKEGSGRKSGSPRKVAIWLIESGELERQGRKWKQLTNHLKAIRKVPQAMTDSALRAAVFREEQKRINGARKK